jgi:hypothetical protein
MNKIYVLGRIVSVKASDNIWIEYIKISCLSENTEIVI